MSITLPPDLKSNAFVNFYAYHLRLLLYGYSCSSNGAISKWISCFKTINPF